MTNEEATIDIPAAQSRLEVILAKEPGATLTQVHPPLPTHHPAPNRKPRSDKGVPKKPPVDPDEITLKLTLAEARNAATACGKFGCYGISEHIQDQIIAQLQRRLDQLQKGK